MLKIVFLFYLILLKTQLNAQQQFRSFTINQGLSHNSVHCIFKDSDGLLWIGTQDGLNKYDGKRFTIYKPITNDTNSISDNFILDINEDAEKNIWVATRWGLNKLNKRTGKAQRYFIKASERKLFQASYDKVFVDDTKNIFLFRLGNIYTYNKSKNEFVVKASLGENTFLIGQKNNQYIYAINNKGVYKYSTLKGHEFITNINSDFKKAFYVCNEKYLVIASKVDKSKVEIYDLIQSKWLPPLQLQVLVNHVFLQKNNTLLLATTDGLYTIHQFNKIEKSNFANSNGFPTGVALSTYADEENGVWVGMAGSGFAYTSNQLNRFNKITTPIKDNMVSSSAFLFNNIYIGTNNGLFYQDTLTKAVSEVAAFKNKRITALCTDGFHIWIGVNNEGIYIIKPNGQVLANFTTTNSPLQSNQIFHLACNNNKVAISTEIDFYEFTTSTKTWKQFSVEKKDVNSYSNYVLHSSRDKADGYWLSCNYGLVKVNNQLVATQTIASASDTSAIKRTLISCVAIDNTDTKWIGTISNGIYKFVDNQLTHYTEAAGLNSNIIYSLAVDKLNRLWATTSSGLHIFNATQNRFNNLSEKDGIGKMAFSVGSMQITNGGQMHIGTSQGLLTVQPETILLQEEPLEARIANIKINGKSVEQLDDNISLYADGKKLEIELLVQNALLYDNIYYQYKIEGLQEEWITLPNGINTFSVSNLPYKRLKLAVRAANTNNDFTNAAIHYFTIYAKPPFYKTWWFLSLLFCLALFGIVVFINNINKVKYQKKIALLETQKKLQAERERIGRDLHDNIGAYSSALIAGLNRLGKNEQMQTVEQNFKQQELNDLKEFADNIMTNLRETIWILNTEQLSIQAFADRFKNYLLKMKKLYPTINFIFNDEINTNNLLTPEVAINCFRILQEAFHNSCKHAKPQTITFTIREVPHLYFSIADDGIGFDSATKNEGYGLTNMQERAKSIGFEWQQISNESGTITIIQNTTNAVS